MEATHLKYERVRKEKALESAILVLRKPLRDFYGKTDEDD